MAGRLDEVRATVDNPEVVTRDVTYAHRENHYRRTPSGRRRTKVVVHYRPVPPQGTWAGEVITALHVKKVDPEEKQLWP